MVLDASLLNTQHYKVRVKGKVEQSGEGESLSSTEVHLNVVDIEKEPSGRSRLQSLNLLIWLSDGTLIETSTSDQSDSGINSKEGLLHTSQISRTWFSPSDSA